MLDYGVTVVGKKGNRRLWISTWWEIVATFSNMYLSFFNFWLHMEHIFNHILQSVEQYKLIGMYFPFCFVFMTHHNSLAVLFTVLPCLSRYFADRNCSFIEKKYGNRYSKKILRFNSYFYSDLFWENWNQGSLACLQSFLFQLSDSWAAARERHWREIGGKG